MTQTEQIVFRAQTGQMLFMTLKGAYCVHGHPDGAYIILDPDGADIVYNQDGADIIYSPSRADITYIAQREQMA